MSKSPSTAYTAAVLVFVFLMIAFAVLNVVAWITHWVVMIPQAFADGSTWQTIILTIAGIIPPVGIIHGWIIWFT